VPTRMAWSDCRAEVPLFTPSHYPRKPLLCGSAPLRALLLRQWKRKRFIVRRLIKLGVRPATGWRGVYQGHKSWWALSHSTPVDRGLPNAYFAKGGLESLEAQWREIWAHVVRASAQLSLELR